MMHSKNEDITRGGRWSDGIKPALLLFVGLICVPLVATFVISGKSSTEKLATQFAQPLFVAIVVSALVGCVLIRRGERVLGWMLIGIVCLLWSAGSSVVVSPIFRKWELSVTPVIPSSERPFDYVVVLGGGTSRNPDGRPQFGEAGDRVGYAAMLFIQGKTKNLITTGDTLVVTKSLHGVDGSLEDPSNQTRGIWSALGIPDENVMELPGENTNTEIASLRDKPEWWKGKRCGLLTSAFHLPRAMKLAERAGVDVDPLAADFRSSVGPLFIADFFPKAGNLSKLELIFKEWIGIRMGR